ncbi:MAG: SDR family NAD(P)-dependent oxidoreductase [bacterium]
MSTDEARQLGKALDVAIVGLGGIFPDAPGIGAFWANIRGGRNSIAEIPPERWDPQVFFHPDRHAPDKTYCKIGAFIRGFKFDPLRYQIPPRTARQMDRSQQLAIAAVEEAIQDAGLCREVLREKSTAVILGNTLGGESIDRSALRVYASWMARELAARGLGPPAKTNGSLESSICEILDQLAPALNEDSLPGELPNVIAGRVAAVFDLHGQSCVVDAACASAMAAVAQAVRVLRMEEADLAISGGVDSNMSPSVFVKFSKIGALSPDGSRPFDRKANGFVMGEGAGILVLKRLEDAIRDRDRIYAVIKGVGASSDGKGKGITAPNPEGQRRAIEAAFRTAGICPSTVGLVEAHGTATPVGDRTELSVLEGFWKSAGAASQGTAIGSIKSQIGHLKSAAGAASLVKTALAVHHGILPPSINCPEPLPSLCNGSPFFIPSSEMPWPSGDRPRRAAVSAFGFGGTNFSIVLEQAPSASPARCNKNKPEKEKSMPVEVRATPAPRFYPIVAADRSRPALRRKLEDLCARFRTCEDLREWSERERTPAGSDRFRVALAAATPEDLRARIQPVLAMLEDPSRDELAAARGIHVVANPCGQDAKVAFLFPGQGSQYAFMLHDLKETYPIVRKTFEEADTVLAGLLDRPLSRYIFSEEDREGAEDYLRQTRITQPAVLAADTAMFRLLTSLGISPDMVAGHSLGEYGACVAAGVLSFPDALHAVSLRGKAMAEIDVPDPGKMVAVVADESTVLRLAQGIPGYLEIANKNGPLQMVVAGESQPIQVFQEKCARAGINSVELNVSAAFHSKIVAVAKGPYGRVLRELEMRPPRIPIYANLTGDLYPADAGATGKILELLNEQFAAPVEWIKTMENMYSDGARVFIECGPKKVLSNLARMNLEGRPALVLDSNHPKKPALEQLCSLVALLRANGREAHWPGGNGSFPREIGIPAPSPARVPAPATEQAASSAAGKETQPGRSQSSPKERSQSSGAGGAAFPVMTGYSLGFPSFERGLFDPMNMAEVMQGRGFISPLSDEERHKVLDKGVRRLEKKPDGETYFHDVEALEEVIQLAGIKGPFDLVEEYGVDERLAKYMDASSKMAIAAALEALRDAGIPLVRSYKRTKSGRLLPGQWMLPESLRDETGVIFASALPNGDTLVEEVTAYLKAKLNAHARKLWVDSVSSILPKLRDPDARDLIGQWFSETFAQLKSEIGDDAYHITDGFLFKACTLGHAQVAQYVGARGPNTNVNGACASMAQAVIIARDWIVTGRAKRVLVVGADDSTNQTLLQWVGTGFLASGAASTKARVEEAALPFDNRRNGMILGSGAVGVVLEADEEAEHRGVKPVARLIETEFANSAYHVSRLEVDHIAAVMERMISRWERESGGDRHALARDLIFMSHETYTPKRGGSAQAEVEALKRVFGPAHKDILITNVKGYTGHPLGGGLEEGVVLACLEQGQVPPLPNFREVDPELGELNYSKGGPHKFKHALRLAAGFGSQICLTLVEYAGRTPDDKVLPRYQEWLREVVGSPRVELEVVKNVLRVAENGSDQKEAPSDSPAAPAAAASIPAARPDPVPPTRAAQPQEGPRAPSRREPVEKPGRSATGEQDVLEEVIGAQSGPQPINGENAVAEAVLSLVAEKTGYPPDMLDLDLDLEADLGIDTIKQAELFGEIRKAFALPPAEGLKIADFPTLRRVIQWAEGRLAANLPTAPLPPAQLTDPVREVDSSKAAPQPLPGQVRTTTEAPAGKQDLLLPAAEPKGAAEGEVTASILSMVAEKTGYPPDMLDLDLDLEADLGIDTIKQAELFGEIRKAFALPPAEGLKIADFPTLRRIVRWVEGRIAESAGSAGPGEAGQQAVASETGGPSLSMIDTLVPVPVDLPDVSKESPVPEPGCVLLAGGPEELCILLSRSLQARGIRCVRAARDVLLQDDSWLRGLAGTPEAGVVNLLGLEPGPQSVYATFALNRALAAQHEVTPTRILAVIAMGGSFLLGSSSLAFSTAAEEAAAHSGGICGSTKAFQQEFPGSSCTVLDLDAALRLEDKWRFIEQELFAAGPLEVGRDQRGCRTGISLEPVKQPGSPARAIRPGDVILATGGAKGITAECLKALARRGASRIAMLGTSPEPGHEDAARMSYSSDQWAGQKKALIEQARSGGGKPKPAELESRWSQMKGMAEAARTFEALRQTGAEILYLQADVADPAGLAAAVRQVKSRWGRIDMVIHGAGREESKSLAKKSAGTMRRLYDIKVAGLQNLRTAVGDAGMQPELWILFSSVSGRFGNAGQNDYSAANEALNFAARFHRLHAKGARFLAPNWGPWAEVGMAARGSTPEAMKAKGIALLPPGEATDALSRLIGRSDLAGDLIVTGKLGEDFGRDALASQAEREALEQRVASDLGSLGAEVREYVPGVRLVLRLDLSPATANFLDHHRISGTAVLPGVAALGLFAYGAARLAGSRHLHGFEDVVFERPLKFHQDRTTPVEIELSRAGEAGGGDGRMVFDACLRSYLPPLPKASAPAPREILHHRARAVTGRAPVVLEPSSLPALPIGEIVSKREIYERLFHGPLFQVLSSVQGCADRCLQAQMDPERNVLLGGQGSPMEGTRPALVEAGFQAAGLWAMIERRVVCLPHRVERIILASASGPPSRVQAAHREYRAGEHPQYVFDAEIQDRAGRPAARLEGLSLIQMDTLPEALGFRIEGAASEREEHGFIEELVFISDLRKTLEAKGSAGIREILHPAELEVFRKWKHPTRAWAWLGGRAAAKKALHRFLRERRGEDLPLREILIWNDEAGKPFCNVAGVHLSIAHKETMALGAVADEEEFDGIGVDLEAVASLDPATVEQFFTAGEQQLAMEMIRRSGRDGMACFSHLWSLKEAALKTLGLGLRVDTRQVEVTAVSPAGRAEIALHDVPPGDGSGAGPCPHRGLSAWIEEREGHVIARSWFRRCSSCRPQAEREDASSEVRQHERI